MLAHSIHAQAIMGSFHKWASKDKKWKSTYKKVPSETWTILGEAVSEIDRFTPEKYDLWYAVNHMRYFKLYRQEHVNMVKQLAREYFYLLNRGKLGAAKDKKNGRKAPIS